MIASFLMSVFVMLFGMGLTAYGFKYARQNYQAIRKQMEVNHQIAAPIMPQLDDASDVKKETAYVF